MIKVLYRNNFWREYENADRDNSNPSIEVTKLDKNPDLYPPDKVIFIAQP